MLARECEDCVHGRERELGYFGRDYVRASHKSAVTALDFLGPQLGGRSTRHVDRAVAIRVDDHGGKRTRTAVERQMLRDPEAIHPGAQEFTVPVIPHFAEDTGAEPEHSRPTKMVEYQAAHLGPLHRATRVMGVQNGFFVSGDDSWSAVEQIYDHAPASHDVEFSVSHAREELRAPARAPGAHHIH